MQSSVGSSNIWKLLITAYFDPSLLPGTDSTSSLYALYALGEPTGCVLSSPTCQAGPFVMVKRSIQFDAEGSSWVPTK